MQYIYKLVCIGLFCTALNTHAEPGLTIDIKALTELTKTVDTALPRMTEFAQTVDGIIKDSTKLMSYTGSRATTGIAIAIGVRCSYLCGKNIIDYKHNAAPQQEKKHFWYAWLNGTCAVASFSAAAWIYYYYWNANK